MDIQRPASSQDITIYTPSVHSISFHASDSLPCILALRSTLADVSSIHTFMAGFIHQPPSSCLRHLCSDITCDIRQDLRGDPCSRANIRWLSEASATATQWQKNSFSCRAWPRNKAKDWQTGRGQSSLPSEMLQQLVHTHDYWKGKV